MCSRKAAAEMSIHPRWWTLDPDQAQQKAPDDAGALSC
jgi:hypothetical protein